MASEQRIKLEAGELAWLCEQLALIQRSGLLMPEGIELLAESAETSRLKTVLDRLHKQIQSMVPLSDAMRKANAFPDYLIRMVHIGELSGNIDQILSSLTDFYLRDSELRKKVRSALIYPIVLLCMMLAIILLLIIRVLPVFSQILASFGGALPRFSQGLMSLGLFISRHAIWLIPIVILCIIGLVIFFRCSKPGRRFIDRSKLRLPIQGPLYRRIYASRFATSMHYLLRSGIDLDEALMMTESIMDNSVVSARIAESRNQIRQGSDLFDALRDTNLFPNLFIRMLALGSRAGELDQVMSKVAAAYEHEVNNRLTRFASLIEPIMVMVLSVIVGAILLTVMLPLIEIMSSIG